MGKRKSRAKPVKRMEQKVPTTFDCPFCNHEKAVDCKIDKDTSIGSIRCRVCNESYQMITNYLSEPIDVYSEWIDQCEAANQ
ncbi:elongation factor 1, putative [Acanthamoeba castellanii str. Neff]|uniref:Transcription elongation factor 1 homolog n=1 Tax=Acanthamoeba castellanii (strain ATCC 30010 / Neff) TaxID=1257118 RepID=L8HKF8_ACACF|nr:elongation factor 1, putative [Acanthamoeba castellanii str. Neff]ELR25143.1 elongation factor 1, putative [Acanthamoeba castellanii str. Neff]